MKKERRNVFIYAAVVLALSALLNRCAHRLEEQRAAESAAMETTQEMPVGEGA